MRVSVVTAPGETKVLDVPVPAAGAKDVLVKMRACGICGSDAFYIALGGVPPRQGHTPLGHEPAGEVVEVGDDVTGISVGDHVVVNPMAGADAVINSADEDVAQRLIELHGAGESMFPGKADTDIYFDAAGAPAVINTALAAAKPGARLGVVAVHKESVPVDFVNIMSNEITIVGSMGYPDEIFEVTKDLIANWEKYAVIVSHTIPFEDVGDALRIASTPGAADKVVVTFN